MWFDVQVLALFAGQPYDSELQDLANLDSHLTNTCRLEGAGEEEEAVKLLTELPQVGVVTYYQARILWIGSIPLMPDSLIFPFLCLVSGR